MGISNESKPLDTRKKRCIQEEGKLDGDVTSTLQEMIILGGIDSDGYEPASPGKAGNCPKEPTESEEGAENKGYLAEVGIAELHQSLDQNSEPPGTLNMTNLQFQVLKSKSRTVTRGPL
ncbi:hypothetical protein R1flu_014533 [Riccia fluitans]|uniref:Uncharacterized protein n=1 Tax=Riccia fluitans TaxID=41844 RepID=A0ABD1YJH0_9MARC